MLQSFRMSFPIVFSQSWSVSRDLRHGLRHLLLVSRRKNVVSGQRAALSTDLAVDEEKPEERKQRVSKAMTAYLAAAREREVFMQKKRDEFEMGKRHLANMMGWDSHNVSQDDIDSAIRYLFPSALFVKEARPMMRPPDEVYPKAKAAMFSDDGRPLHYLFYTGWPLYYEILSNISKAHRELDEFEDRMIAKGILSPPKEGRVELAGTQWITFPQMQSRLMENIRETDYEYLIKAMERLAEHPYSVRVKDLFMKYRTELTAVTLAMEYPPPTIDENTAQPYADAVGLRKHCKAQVRVYGNGTGKFEVNGKDLSYWNHLYHREQILFPLSFTGMLRKVDIVATVEGIGEAAQAGAVRHGISLALRSLLTPGQVESMRIAGLLTKDRRVHERKKPGRERARKKWKWLKR